MVLAILAGAIFFYYKNRRDDFKPTGEELKNDDRPRSSILSPNPKRVSFIIFLLHFVLYFLRKNKNKV